MKRWNMDGDQVLQYMKKRELKISGGTFDDEVTVERLLLPGKAPYDIDDTIASFQFALSEIEAIENEPNFRKDISSPIVDIDTPRDADKKLRPDQKAKNKCRDVAKKLREKNPNITIAAAIRHKYMMEVSKKKDGNHYVEKVVRDWIKDLWPEEMRKPGRRKGT